MSIIGTFIVPHPPIILPQIGKGEEKKIQKTRDAYQKVALMIKELQPEVIVLTSPHSIMYADYFHISPGEKAYGNFKEFGKEELEIKVEYDEQFITTLSDLAKEEGNKAGILGEIQMELDHGTMIPLYFINQIYSNYKLVRIGLSGLSFLEHYYFGKQIKKTAELLNKKTVFLASGDLSHKLKENGSYGYIKEGVEYDKKITEIMKKGNFLQMLYFSEDFCEKAAECGHRSFLIMAGALDMTKVKPQLLSYEGTFGVGYAVASFLVEGEDKKRCFDKIYIENQKEIAKKKQKKEDDYVKLARLSLETYIKEDKVISPPLILLKEILEEKAGVFVSLKKHGQLRGCIGTIEATQSCIAKEIIGNAISAGTKDPRFLPVKKEELEELVYSVDILGKVELVYSKEKLDVKKYGVIVSKGHRKGLLLPNLEGVDTVEQQLEIALQKAGIEETQNYKIERFEVVRHY